MPGEHDPAFMSLLEVAANGNGDALTCLVLFVTYGHKFDDIIDKDVELTAANMVECNNIFLRLTTCPFFDKNRQVLMAQLLLIGETYAASEELKGSGFEQKRAWANYMRHCGNDFVRTVALLTGGEQGLNYTSRKLREFSMKDHYTTDLKPI